MNTSLLSYEIAVIQAWDDASQHFKRAAIEANKNSLAWKAGLLEGNRLNVPRNIRLTQMATNKAKLGGYEIQTDGVGTKGRIYMRAFNGLYEGYRARKSAVQKWHLITTAKILFYRMLLDLYAMNVDDFRHGDIALAVSDILDIDHITLTGEDAEQGEIFCTAFADAIGRVIDTTWIALVAGETAILGDGDKLADTRENFWWIVENILALKQSLDKITETMGELSPGVRDLVIQTTHLIDRGATGFQQRQASIDRQVELNLWGSTTGYRNGEKLVPMEAGDVVIALFENKTDKGIISPRANGISAIRKTMTELLGEDWPLMTLMDYFHELDGRRIAVEHAVQKRLANMWLSTPLWDIATGETTVFNPLVGGTLLGGIEKWPVFPGAIAGQIHVTGNPVGKWSDVVADSGYGIDIDYSEVEIPQIIEMCMIAEWQSFADGMKKWNMGIPYALVCSREQAKQVTDEICSQGYSAKIVGKITKPYWEWLPMIEIRYPDGDQFLEMVKEVRK